MSVVVLGEDEGPDDYTSRVILVDDGHRGSQVVPVHISLGVGLHHVCLENVRDE